VQVLAPLFWRVAVAAAAVAVAAVVVALPYFMVDTL